MYKGKIWGQEHKTFLHIYFDSRWWLWEFGIMTHMVGVNVSLGPIGFTLGIRKLF